MSQNLAELYFGRWRAAWQGSPAHARMHWQEISQVTAELCIEDVSVFEEQFLPYASSYIARWPSHARVASAELIEVLATLDYSTPLALFDSGRVEGVESLMFVLRHRSRSKRWLRSLTFCHEIVPNSVVNDLIRAPCAQAISRVVLRRATVKHRALTDLGKLFARCGIEEFEFREMDYNAEQVLSSHMSGHMKPRRLRYHAQDYYPFYDTNDWFMRMWYERIVHPCIAHGVEELEVGGCIVHQSSWQDLFSIQEGTPRARSVTFVECIFDVDSFERADARDPWARLTCAREMRFIMCRHLLVVLDACTQMSLSVDPATTIHIVCKPEETALFEHVIADTWLEPITTISSP